jgi:quercetin dioxygenase-like cupin family protein
MPAHPIPPLEQAEDFTAAAAEARGLARWRGQSSEFDWEGVECLAYNQNPGSPFRDVTRRVLFDEEHGLGIQFRYFEVAPGGWSTLEHHGHPHLVIPVRGSGRILVGDQVIRPALHDLVYIPSWAWHQLRADPGQPLGFYCLVTTERDRPVLASPDDIAEFERDPVLAEFIRY